MLSKRGRCERSEKHEDRFLNQTQLLALGLLQRVVIFDLLHYLQPVFARHLEVKQHEVDWTYGWLVDSVLDRLVDGFFCSVYCILPVLVELTDLGETELYQVILKNFDVYQLVVRYNQFLSSLNLNVFYSIFIDFHF